MMAMPNDLLILAVQIKKLSHNDLHTFAHLLIEGANDDDDFDWEDEFHVMRLINDFATMQIEADD